MTFKDTKKNSWRYRIKEGTKQPNQPTNDIYFRKIVDNPPEEIKVTFEWD